MLARSYDGAQPLKRWLEEQENPDSPQAAHAKDSQLQPTLWFDGSERRSPPKSSSLSATREIHALTRSICSIFPLSGSTSTDPRLGSPLQV